VTNTRFNHILFITNVKKSELAISMNQKIKKVVYNNCEDCQLQTLDSAVIGSRTVEFVNVKNCTILYDEVDVRLLRFYNCEGNTTRGITNHSICDLLHARFIQFQSTPTLKLN